MSEGSGEKSKRPTGCWIVRRAGWCGCMPSRGTSLLSHMDRVADYASRFYLWPGDVAEVANINEDVSDIIAHPRGVCSHS